MMMRSARCIEPCHGVGSWPRALREPRSGTPSSGVGTLTGRNASGGTAANACGDRRRTTHRASRLRFCPGASVRERKIHGRLPTSKVGLWSITCEQAAEALAVGLGGRRLLDELGDRGLECLGGLERGEVPDV